MTHIKNIIALTVISASLAACGGNSDTKKTADKTNPAAPTDQVKAPAPDPSPTPPKTLADYWPSVNLVQSNEISRVGESYERDFEVAKPMDCLNGEVAKSPITKVEIATNTEFSTTDSDALFKAKASIGLPVIVGAKANFLYTTKETDRSITAVAYYSTDTEKRTFKVNQDDPLTPAAKRLIENEGPLAFRKLCGNEYVHSTTLGSRFLVGYQFTFSSSAMKLEFKARAKGSLGKFIPVKGALDAFKEHFHQTGTLRFRIEQIGGDRSAAAQAKAITNKGAILECRENADDCFNVVDRLNNLIASSSFTRAMTSGPMDIVKVRYESLENILPPSTFTSEAAASFISPEIKQMRKRLREEIVARQSNIEALNSEKEHISRAIPEEKLRLQQWFNDLANTEAVVKGDLSNLNNSFITCYDDAKNCLTEGQKTLDQLTSVEAVEHRRIWIPTGDHADRWHRPVTCTLPIWSTINTVKATTIYDELELGYYSIDPITGLLSELKYKYCGKGGTFNGRREFANSFLEVALPKEYVMTALMHDTHKGIMRGMSLKGQKWNSEMFAPAGAPEYRYDVNNRDEGKATLPDYQVGNGVYLNQHDSSARFTVISGAIIQ